MLETQPLRHLLTIHTLLLLLKRFGRRNITDFVRAELALQAKPIISARAKLNQYAGINQHSLSANLPEPSIDTRE